MGGDYKMINADLLERLYLGITSMTQYIEAARPGNILRWFADGETPVTSLPDFGVAKKAAAELKPLLTSNCSRASILACLCPFPGTLQAIIITKSEQGNFVFWHKHRDFAEEAYIARSVKGLLNQIENILNGYRPDVMDSYRRNDSEPVIHTSGNREPMPLD